MEAAAHNPQFAAVHHISEEVAKEFLDADKAAGNKYKKTKKVKKK